MLENDADNVRKLAPVFADTDEDFDLLALASEDGDEEKKLSIRHGPGTSIPNLTQLKPNHLKIVEYHLRGYKQSEICKILSCSPFTVHRVLKDPLVQPYISYHRNVMDMEFAALRPAANQAVRKALDSKDDRTALMASRQFYEHEGDMKDKDDKAMTAEDLVTILMEKITLTLQVNTQVNIDTKGGS